MRISHPIISCLAVVSGLSLPGVLASQSATLGTIHGTVVDGSGRPLAGVRVVVRGADGGGERRVQSGRGGLFRVPLLPPGTWTARAENVGYRPQLVLGIPVRPAGDVYVAVTLQPEPPPVTRVDTVTWTGSGGAITVGGWYPEAVMERQALPGSGLLGVLSLGPASDEAVGGLPARMLGLEVNGFRSVQARHPGLGTDPAPDLAWPRSAVSAADYDALIVNPRRSEAPAGVLAGFLRRGPQRLTASVGGGWQPGSAASSRFYSPPARTSWRASATVAGPVVRDTADFALFVDLEDRAIPQAAPWSGAPASDTVLGAARDTWSTDLGAWQRPWFTRHRSARVVGRFDWLVSPRHLVSVTGAWGRLEVTDPDYGAGRLGWLGSRVEGTDWHGGASLVSRLGGVANEIRLAASRTEREAVAPAGGRSVFVDEALAVGTSPGFGGTHARRGFSITDILHVPAGRHAFAFGASLALDAADATHAWGTGGERFYADATSFAAGTGALVAVASGTIPAVRHTSVGLGAWIEDIWQAAPGLELTAGLRMDVLGRPQDAVATNVAWQTRTGLDNASYAATVTRLSPRGALRWTPSPGGGWSIELAGTLRSSGDEHDVFNELIAHDGRVTVRRAVGALGAWPDPSGAGTPRARLALLAPDFVPPRTGRAEFTVTGDLGGVVLRLGGAYRHTDFLPRRTDLNRLPAPAAADQDGRPVYGTLVQQGGLLAADPSAGRRFSGFDLVSALNADGAQDRWEATVAVERRFGAGVGLLLAYTRSSTRDNWLGGLGGAPDDQLDPFPDGLAGAAWSEGVSDFDRPHRLIGALDLLFVRGLRVGGVFRLESGRPFTPGFRPGVDANADGSARNDPAFIDPGVPGMDALLAAWPCLAASSGRFAPRNGCRMPTTRALDLWLRLDLGAMSGLPLALTVEARNVIEPDRALPDAALVLVDASTAIIADPAAGTVTVPLRANPNFGSPLVRRASAREVWIGLRVN